MKISEISNGMKDVEIEGTVKEVTEPRPVNTKFGPNQVANALIQDDSGEVALVLWGDKIDLVKAGSKVKVTGAYVTEWSNKIQLNIPRNGEMIVE